MIESVKEKINSIKGFSGVVSINKENYNFFKESYGFADIANERENNISTRFGIASGAKIFTSIAICKLVDEGKLRFNSLAKNYIDLPNYDDNITIEHLLTHTSGIPDYFDEDVIEDFSGLWVKNPMYLLREPKDFIPLLKEGRMKSSPGEKFSYNNSAFVLLALIVEKVSGVSFKDFVQNNIFNLLEMDNSGYFAMDMLPKNCAYGYEENEDGKFKTNIYSIPVVGGGDGGVFVTVDDMSKLWKGLINSKLLKKETTKKLLTPQVFVNNDVYYGYGIWIIKRYDEIYKYYLTGSDPGVSFMSSVYPGKEMEVTVLANKGFGAYEISMGIEKMNS